MMLSTIFQVGNVFVLPFWLMMIVLPNWELSRKIMSSFIPFALLAALYLYMFVNSLDPDSSAAFANPTLADIARLFSKESVALTGWIHYLVMDLFVGRWIYWEGQSKNIFTTHSLILCLFAGPLGLLSHIVTSWIKDRMQEQGSVEG